MGELFAHFEGWDVQAIRKEAREEARKEVARQVKQQVTEEVTQEVTESDIQKLLAVLRKLGCPRETAIEQLMEQKISAKKVDDFWERS